jgi:transcriptional regulator with XRE-family HTH domain
LPVQFLGGVSNEGRSPRSMLGAELTCISHSFLQAGCIIVSVMDGTDTPETFSLDPDGIANFVRLQRRIFGRKQDMLASEAGVSLATVSRVERGFRIRPSQLRKLSVALRQPADEFLRKRVRPTPEEAYMNFANMFAWTDGHVAVDVAPFRTEAQLRATLQTRGLFTHSDLGDDAEADIDELLDWLDLVSFIQAERHGLFGRKSDRSLKVRELWRDVLACVERIERTHVAVCLTGTYMAKPTEGGAEFQVAILAIRSRKRNPAAGNLSVLWVEKAVDLTVMLNAYLQRDPI